MPKIELNKKDLFLKLPKDINFEKILESAKAEIDYEDEDTLKIELNDTNRPDLWGSEGILRHINNYLGLNNQKNYNFNYSGNQIFVKNVENIRPFIAGFIVKNVNVRDDILKELVQKQEKLSQNFGSKRKIMSIGLYVNDLINYPIFYESTKKTTKFTPLHQTKESSLEEILQENPKGKEYSNILKDKEFYPILKDSKGHILSFPPIINSNHLGEVKIGDKNLFVEFTGTSLQTVLLACNIFAVDMLDSGYEVESVEVIYDYDTKFSSSYKSPFYFQDERICSKDKLFQIFGQSLDDNLIKQSLNKMGLFDIKIEDKLIRLNCPIYRNDFISEVDICEDILIGYGIDNIKKEVNLAFTKGSLTKIEKISRKIKDIMIGLGYQEMIFNYLGSKQNFVSNMLDSENNIIEVENYISQNYQIVRNSGLPSLLIAEQNSQNTLYPHMIFEIGKIIKKDLNENLGSKTLTSLSFLQASKDANFNLIHAQVINLLYFLNFDIQNYLSQNSDKNTISIQKLEDKRFIKGRCAKLVYKKKDVAKFGELHPQILQNFQTTMPSVAFEMYLEYLL